MACCEDATKDASVEDGSGLESRSIHGPVTRRKDAADRYTNKKLYLKRFAQSWKFYAKANDIAKREKLRKALLDALRSMNNKKKTTMTSLTHDSVSRIQHAAKMLKEFKRMYKLSNDVLSTWKDYSSARRSLLDIGKTKEGNDILKKYVVLREEVSNHIKRSEIARPSIVDDQDIDENIAKDNIARHGQELNLGNVIVQRAMTPGTLQIIRTTTKHRNTEAQKRMDLLSDAKDAARTAYGKAKEAINALKERLKGIASTKKEKEDVEQKNRTNETNDKGTNKKSILAENNEVKGESLGHVNTAMALAGMIKKAEKADLERLNQGTNVGVKQNNGEGTAQSNGQLSAANSPQINKGSVETKIVDEGNEKANNNSFHQILNGAQNGVKTETQKYDKKVGPTTSISSLMDSLAGEEEPTNSPTSGAKNASVPVNGITTTDGEGVANAKPLNASPGVSKETEKTNIQGAEASGLNQSNPILNNATNTTNHVSNNTISTVAAQDIKATKVVLMSSHTAEQKLVQVVHTPLTSEKANETSSVQNNIASNKTKTDAISGSKRFRLNELKIQERVVKTIDRQLETLKRLQEAKRARKRYDTAKHELQVKIKKLYDMAVSFEKPINNALMSTKTNIDPNPSKDDHPGAALAGISDKPATAVQTPSDDSEHHGFTLGAMDNKAMGKAHIVDLNKESDNLVNKVYQIEMGGTNAESSKKSENGDQALKSLTEAIKNDLKKIELNQAEQAKARKHSEDMKQALEPIITEMSHVKLKSENNEKSVEKTEPEMVMQALGDKKDKQEGKPGETDEAAAKAQDAFKEVEDYLSKALKHVAKEAISEDDSASKEVKESSGVVNEESAKTKAHSPTERVTNPTATVKADIGNKEKEAKDNEKDEKVEKISKSTKEKAKEKDKESDKEKEEDKEDKEKSEKEKGDKETGKEKAMDKDERLRKIVEDAMKEHAKDPTNPHPINADLLKPTTKLKEEAMATKPADTSKKDDKNPADQKSNPTEAAAASAPATSASASTPTDATIQRSPNDAIGKAEHLEEQVAKLQDKLYSQGNQNDAYKTIDNVEDKPLFSQDANPGEQQPAYQEHMHHHSHRRHHSPYEDEEEEERAGYERGGNDRDYDDDDEEDDDGEDEDQREDYDDDEEEEDRKRKKSFLQPYSWPQQAFRNYQRDRIYSKQPQQQQQRTEQPLMNAGMMGDGVRDELEDMKKSTVPKVSRQRKNNDIPIRGNKMFIL